MVPERVGAPKLAASAKPAQIISTKLRNLMTSVPDNMKFATANFMGYGLFDPAIMSKRDFAALGNERV